MTIPRFNNPQLVCYEWTPLDDAEVEIGDIIAVTLSSFEAEHDDTGNGLWGETGTVEGIQRKATGLTFVRFAGSNHFQQINSQVLVRVNYS